MSERKRYIVDIDAMEVREVVLEDGIEYEILATYEEVKQIENLFNDLKDDTAESLKYLLLPFNERAVDSERESYNEHLLEIFRIINDLGTKKTKENIAAMRIFE